MGDATESSYSGGDWDMVSQSDSSSFVDVGSVDGTQDESGTKEVAKSDLSASYSSLTDSLPSYWSCPLTCHVCYGPRDDDVDESLAPLIEQELSLKAARQLYYNNPNLMFGKRRRRRCWCSSCHERATAIQFERLENPETPALSLLPQSSNKRRTSTPCKNEAMTMTSVDFTHRGESLNKAKRWETARAVLFEHATMVGRGAFPSLNEQRTATCHVFDVEVCGVLTNLPANESYWSADVDDASSIAQVLSKREETDEDLISLRRSKDNLRKAWKMFKGKMHLYQFRHANGRTRCFFKTHDVLDIAAEVKVMRTPAPVTLDEDREEFAHFQASFISKMTRQEPLTHLRVPMIHEATFFQELHQTTQKRHYFHDVAPSAINNIHCWASTPCADMDYDEWFLEADLGKQEQGGVNVLGIVMQGRSPRVQSFPNKACFVDENEWRDYAGPIYPVAVPNEGYEQFVQNVEVQARTSKSSWFSLGTFKANENSSRQVRINFPMLEGMKIRFLRVRPLAKTKNGFAGPAPAFKLAIIISKESRSARIATTSFKEMPIARFNKMETVPKGFIRYVLTYPREVLHERTDEESKRGHGHSRRSAFTQNMKLTNSRYWKNYSPKEYEKRRPYNRDVCRGLIRDELEFCRAPSSHELSESDDDSDEYD